MNILSIDTTTKSASVSLFKDGNISNKEISNEITHSEKLLPIIDEILSTTNTNIQDIDTYLVLNGPGSFTGIRIGLSTIKAFSYVYKKDIFSITSTMLMSYCAYKSYYFINNELKNINTTQKKYIISLVDAKNGRFYYSIYSCEEIGNKIKQIECFNIKNDTIDFILDDVLSYLNQNNIDLSNVIFVGNTLKEYENIIIQKLNIDISKLICLYPTTNDLIDAYINLENINDFKFNSFNLDAVYARKSQAERLKYDSDK